ncbi:DUF6134 family protein [Arenibacter palladensis]|uniref:DUF6134 family protein n=1 Tax=Arenibacter palladensis TaxID=237373 RepID=UPI0026E1CD2F|nr:DUF6134 family protein [Arenibacter palladensis]MDO6603693.1 hypothetical protein [Arenibacter palladensis]
MIRLPILIGLLVFIATKSTAPNTSKYFDIVLKDKIVGVLKVSQNTKDSITYYQSSTVIKTRLIKDIELDYNYDVSFNDMLLKKTNVQITVNNKPHSETITLWKDGYYQITENSNEENTIIEPIAYTTILLYFQEPVDIDRCYSEQDGSINHIVPLGNHTYKKINSQGKENTYYYNNGILKKAVIDGGIVNFEMVARD